MDNNIAHTLNYGQRVTCTYAEIYLDDGGSKLKEGTTRVLTKHPLKRKVYNVIKDNISDWTSPSDLLIGIIDLTPPFTSKITRGKTHEGILAIGNDILEKERSRFLKYLTNLINENDAAWNQILEQERAAVERKVKNIYLNIFTNKSKVMTAEIARFYEESLQELEHHLRSDLQKVLLSVRANIISDLDKEIKQKLDKEKNILEKILQERYENETFKINKYYKLLLQHEIYRNSQFINHAMIERNDAFKAFCRQVETDNITSTMYVMCNERKKCKIKQLMLENYQNTEITEKIEEIKAKQEVLDKFRNNDITLNKINREWEEKITRVLKLFIKFISFSLKLLPEQTMFLLDFQKMVVLQLNEIQKMPEKCPSILISEEKLQNIFNFEQPEVELSVCDNEPFVIVGDQSDIPQPQYGSRETIPSDVDLPIIRLQRQFVYAKCHNFEEIKELLEKERCKCADIGVKVAIPAPFPKETPEETQDDVCIDCESSNELLLIEDIHRLHECPVRGCRDWIKRQSFPFLDDYLDFTEENFERVKTILDQPVTEEMTPELICSKSIVYADLVFGASDEPYHTVETQYSSQEEFNQINTECRCVEIVRSKPNICHQVQEVSTSKMTNNIFQKSDSVRMINKIIMKRQDSLKRLLKENEHLLKIFNDESFDFE